MRTSKKKSVNPNQITPESPIFKLMETVSVMAARYLDWNMEPKRLVLGGEERHVLEDAGKRGFSITGPDQIRRPVVEHEFMGWKVVSADCISIIAFEVEIK